MNVIVTGAAGFTGFNLTEKLLKEGHTVYAVVRPDSNHNSRLQVLKGNLHIVELDCNDYEQLRFYITTPCDVLFHLAWFGNRYDLDAQSKNIIALDNLIKAAAEIGCGRIVCTGSQAEYGPYLTEIDENIIPLPIDAYGSAKISAMHLSKQRSSDLGIEWIWGRIFSLYGRYEPESRLLPSMIKKMLNGEPVYLSSCEQYWDYLDVRDAVDAIIALGKNGKAGEVYNIAHGDCRQLKEYVEVVKEITKSQSIVHYGDKTSPFFSLKPDVAKINKHTGWQAKISFDEGIREYIKILRELS